MSPETERDLARRPMRVDFISEVESFDKATGVARMSMQPDPRRYDKVEQDGETCYVDKFLRIAFTLETMVAGAWDGVPSYSFQPRIVSTMDYADARNVALAAEMSSGEYAPPAERPCEQHDIASRQNERGIGFLSVDICGASAMRRKNPTHFDRAYDISIAPMNCSHASLERWSDSSTARSSKRKGMDSSRLSTTRLSRTFAITSSTWA